MIVPNQLKNTSFPLAGRGAYRAQDVDEFQQRVYVAYSELYSENSVLKKKFASLSALVEEYNEGKNSIANAIIKSQSISDKMIADAKAQATDLVSQAKDKAEVILKEAKKQADEYTAEKTSTADAYLSRSQTELERVKKEAEDAAAEYTEKVNEKAEAIIADANEKASKIVAAAFSDAKLAREKCDVIINSAKAELESIKKDIAVFKAQAEKMVSTVLPALDKIDIPAEIKVELTEQDTAVENSDFENEETVEPFEFKIEEPESFEEAQTEAPGSDEEVVAVNDENAKMEFEDISSSSDLESYFSSIIDNIHSSKNSGNDEEASDGSQDSSHEDELFSLSKGYNGNNTSFKSTSEPKFSVTDTDDGKD